MNKEILFAQKLEQVRRLAKEQGNCVQEEQVRSAFAELELDGEQLKLVFDYLAKHRIGIGEPVNPDDYLSEEERDYLQDYLEELERLPAYSDGQIQAYTMSAMAGDVQAQNRLVEIHLKDVVEIARLYAGQGVFLEDLIGEGNVALAFASGMLGSLERPEEAQGMIGKLIMDAMEDYIAENASSEETGRKAVKKVNSVLEKAKELSGELQRKVTVEELARETGMSRKAIRDAVRISGFQIEYIERET